jgi:hypothetical protein
MQMIYYKQNGQTSHKVVAEEEGLRHHDHLKTVYMSGFRLYKAQTKLPLYILENASVLEHMHLEQEGEYRGPCGRQCRDMQNAELPRRKEICTIGLLTGTAYLAALQEGGHCPFRMSKTYPFCPFCLCTIK